MRTFTYAGPDGIEIPEFFSAEWLVLEDRSGELVTPPDVAEEDGPLLRVELRPAHGEPWSLGVPLGPPLGGAPRRAWPDRLYRARFSGSESTS